MNSTRRRTFHAFHEFNKFKMAAGEPLLTSRGFHLQVVHGLLLLVDGGAGFSLTTFALSGGYQHVDSVHFVDAKFALLMLFPVRFGKLIFDDY